MECLFLRHCCEQAHLSIALEGCMYLFREGVIYISDFVALKTTYITAHQNKIKLLARLSTKPKKSGAVISLM